jgi:hypothetical protein
MCSRICAACAFTNCKELQGNAQYMHGNGRPPRTLDVLRTHDQAGHLNSTQKSYVLYSIAFIARYSRVTSVTSQIISTGTLRAWRHALQPCQFMSFYLHSKFKRRLLRTSTTGGSPVTLPWAPSATTTLSRSTTSQKVRKAAVENNFWCLCDTSCSCSCAAWAQLEGSADQQQQCCSRPSLVPCASGL